MAQYLAMRTPPNSARVSLKILVVDDEVIVAEDLALQLREREFYVTGIASTATEAIRLAKENVPDVILMDIRLKGQRNGVEAAAVIQEQVPRPVAILFLSAYDKRQFDGIDEIRNSMYLNKPVHIEDLIQAIQQLARA